MERERLQTKVNEALESCITAKGIYLLDKFTANEVADFANTVTSNIQSETISSTIKSIDEYLDANIDGHKLKEILSAFYYHNYIRNKNKYKISKEHVLFLIVSLIRYYEYDIGDIDEGIQEFTEFLFSFVIENLEDLHKEIEENHSRAITKSISSGFIRVGPDESYIPTTQTINKFKTYLEKWKRYQ